MARGAPLCSMETDTTTAYRRDDEAGAFEERVEVFHQPVMGGRRSGFFQALSRLRSPGPGPFSIRGRLRRKEYAPHLSRRSRCTPPGRGRRAGSIRSRLEPRAPWPGSTSRRLGERIGNERRRPSEESDLLFKPRRRAALELMTRLCFMTMLPNAERRVGLEF